MPRKKSSSVPPKGDKPYGAILPLTEQDKKHRESFEEYASNESTSLFHQQYLKPLYALWKEWNEKYYEGKMIVPHILLGAPASPRNYGTTALISSWGSKSEILLRPSLLDGTHKHVRGEPEFEAGRFLFVQDVLLHEQIHQFHFEVTEEAEESFHGHGPAFRDVCNFIGSQLGLPPVRSMKKRKADKHLPSCAQWPHNVRPEDYYQGAYVPPKGDDSPAPPKEPEPEESQLDIEAVIVLLREGRKALSPLISSARGKRQIGLGIGVECFRQALVLLGAEQED